MTDAPLPPVYTSLLTTDVFLWAVCCRWHPLFVDLMRLKLNKIGNLPNNIGALDGGS